MGVKVVCAPTALRLEGCVGTGVEDSCISELFFLFITSICWKLMNFECLSFCSNSNSIFSDAARCAGAVGPSGR